MNYLNHVYVHYEQDKIHLHELSYHIQSTKQHGDKIHRPIQELHSK